MAVLVVGEEGMAVAERLAAIGHPVVLALLRDDESLEYLWRSNDHEITIDLDDRPPERADLVYLTRPVAHVNRVASVARRLGASAVWTPYPDTEATHRGVIEGAGLALVDGADLVSTAVRVARTSHTSRIELLDALLDAHERWAEIDAAVSEAMDRVDARQQLTDRFGYAEAVANRLLDLPLARRTRLARTELLEERSDCVAALDALGPDQGLVDS